jgi:hypothetical protein
MSATRAVQFRGTVATRGDASGDLASPGDAVIVERGRPRLLLLSCPCGCGEVLTINLDPRADKAWRLYRRDDQITLFPSVWRDTGCRSHFVIWDDVIYWWDGGDPLRTLTAKDCLLEKEVLRLLRIERFLGFVELADMLGEIPYQVLDACRRLVAVGDAVEGEDKQQSTFRLPDVGRSKRWRGFSPQSE